MKKRNDYKAQDRHDNTANAIRLLNQAIEPTVFEPGVEAEKSHVQETANKKNEGF